MTKRVILLAALSLLALLSAGVFLSYRYLLGAPSSDTQPVDFRVESGATVKGVAQELQEADLVRSPLAFRLLIEYGNRTIQAGDYQLSSSMSAWEVAGALSLGRFDQRVTIIEGWRIEEVAEYLSSELGIERADFLAAAEEGYMFPDTYFVSEETTAGEFAALMRQTFERKVTAAMLADLGKQGLSLEEAVTLASIVEREARADEDRPIVAGILLKRLRAGWALEVDATVQYALATISCRSSAADCDWWSENLTQADLELDSPYNTRKYAGLPPGPICNAGLSSLAAGADPAETPYWFYLSDREGEMHYSQTLDEHNRNVVTYLR